MDHRARLLRGMAREKKTKKEKEVQTEMIEVSEKNNDEWLKAERAVMLTNEQILGIQAYYDLSKKDWAQARSDVYDLSRIKNKDGSLKYPKASKAVADMDEMEYQTREAIKRMGDKK